jgi:hypothetical protein
MMAAKITMGMGTGPSWPEPMARKLSGSSDTGMPSL